MIQMKTRKLIPLQYLKTYHELSKLGVPLRKIIRDNDLSTSGPHLAKLLETFHLLAIPEISIGANIVITNSLFPEWLKDTPTVQEQPENYTYLGKFPFGYWDIKV